MSDTTNPSPSGHFALSAFGSVQVAPESTKVVATLTASERADFDRTASYFRAHTKDHVLSVDFPNEDAAKDFRSKARMFAETRDDVSVGFPKATPDRYVVTLNLSDEAVTKAILGKLAVTYDGQKIRIVAAETDTGYSIMLTSGTKATAERVRRDLHSGYGATDGVTEITEVSRIAGANYPAHWNTGVNVTFRFGKARETDKSGTVTVTTRPVKIRAKK